MAMYEYRCNACNHRRDTQRRGDMDGQCPECGWGTLKRVWSVSIPRPMQEHFNHTVGKGISDPRQFKNELRKQGDLYTERTGIPTDYQPSGPDEQLAERKRPTPKLELRTDDVAAVVRKMGGDID